MEANGIYLHGCVGASVHVAFFPWFAIALNGDLFYAVRKSQTLLGLDFLV